jgi:hypothetical protein
VVPVVRGKMTAQLMTSEGSQIATSIDEKLCVGDIVVCCRFFPVPYRLVTAIDTHPVQDDLEFTHRQSHRVKSNRETADGCRRALILPSVLILHV